MCMPTQLLRHWGSQATQRGCLLTTLFATVAHMNIECNESVVSSATQLC